jgi:RHH-type transcriptional regulator, proline utilization regulon repressor / proline dehydrogenase / delta 1-pyrroline-5-carboxylate dehydrogenase
VNLSSGRGSRRRKARETEARARHLVEAVRRGRRQAGGIDEFMQEYALSSEEGVVLMCLAEALLRIPDAATADKLIADKIGGRQWDSHIGHSDSLFVNASAWGLMLTGRFIELSSQPRQDVSGYLRRSPSAPASRWCAAPCAGPCASWASISCSAAPSRRR